MSEIMDKIHHLFSVALKQKNTEFIHVFKGKEREEIVTREELIRNEYEPIGFTVTFEDKSEEEEIAVIIR